MKISYRWLKDFVDTDLGPREVAARLADAGIEVASIAPVAEGLSGVVVGRIDAIDRDLGDAAAGDHVVLCRVAIADRSFSVICGAPNAAVGMRTAFAPPAATLSGGQPVKAVRIRGVMSEGILCSEKELGLSDDHHGILELPADAPLGADLVGYLGLDDAVLEIEITPNRPDVLAVVGVAREIGAITGAQFHVPPVAVREGPTEAARLCAIEIEAADLCPRFCARVVTGLTVRPSPPWLAQRLRAVGLRPINNIVDVTNYVMWELGQPLHAFDLDALAQQKIVVRRPRAGERLVTLDGQERTLGPDMALVCDGERPVGVGGVMGGANTEVTERTTAVLLEAAYWNPGSIRRTARTLGLATDAAYRFERGGDIGGLPDVLDRAGQLMAELGGGVVARGVLDVYPRPRPEVRILLRLSRVERLIGICPPRETVVRILRSLGFEVDESTEALQVTVPSFRRDVLQEDDLVEEVIRIWGYDKIPVALDRGRTLIPVRRPPTLELSRAVNRALTAAGLSECITYSFVDPDRLALMGWRERANLVGLENPLSRERSVMRPSIVPGLLEVLAINANHQVADCRVFETGRVFTPHRDEDGDRPVHEELWAGIALVGLRHVRGWNTSGERVDVYDAKGMAELALTAAGISGWETIAWSEEATPRYLEPGRSARLAIAGREIGRFGSVALAVREAFGLGAPVFVAEVSLSAVLDLPRWSPRYLPLPRYPAMQRDLAIVVSNDVTAAEVEAAIYGLRLPLLTKLSLFDVYAGDQVGPGRRSLAWSLTFQALDRTLRDADVNDVYARIVREISDRFKAEVRAN
jgi:phenylalanyl-tRNA synthetase beta chain